MSMDSRTVYIIMTVLSNAISSKIPVDFFPGHSLTYFKVYMKKVKEQTFFKKRIKLALRSGSIVANEVYPRRDYC